MVRDFGQVKFDTSQDSFSDFLGSCETIVEISLGKTLQEERLDRAGQDRIVAFCSYWPGVENVYAGLRLTIYS